MKTLHSLFAFAASLLLTAMTCQQVQAHTVWLDADTTSPRDFYIRFGGHGGKLQPVMYEKLKQIQVFDRSGNSLAFHRIEIPDSVLLTLPEAAALVTIHYDNGIFSRNAKGQSVPQPMNELPGATRGTWAVKYHKTILQWSETVTQPLGQPFEVIPLSSAAPVAGQPFKVRVLVDGKAAAGVRLGRGEAGDLAVTDVQGEAAFIPEAGFNKLWAGQRTPVEDPRFSELSYEYILGFVAITNQP